MLGKHEQFSKIVIIQIYFWKTACKHLSKIIHIHIHHRHCLDNILIGYGILDLPLQLVCPVCP